MTTHQYQNTVFLYINKLLTAHNEKLKPCTIAQELSLYVLNV